MTDTWSAEFRRDFLDFFFVFEFDFDCIQIYIGKENNQPKDRIRSWPHKKINTVIKHLFIDGDLDYVEELDIQTG